MKKLFDTDVILSVTTGKLLCRFDKVHELMDFFWPGIMTLGTALARPEAAEIILLQHPQLASVAKDSITEDNWPDRRREAIATFGEQLVLDNDLKALCPKEWSEVDAFEAEVNAIKAINPDAVIVTVGT